MKEIIFRILLTFGLIFTSILGNFATIHASNPVDGINPQPIIVLKGGYEAKIVDYAKDGSPIYQVDFGAPTYCDDLTTPIDTQWHEQKDGSFKSGDNKFASSVSGLQITVAKDKENIWWTPILSMIGADQGQDLILNPLNPKPEVLDVDPLNENYQRNTLVWHYDKGIDRYFRLIEAQCQEYFVINNPLENDLVIDPNAVLTPGFVWYKKAAAYDEVGTGIKLTEDIDNKITLKAASAKQSQSFKSLPKAEIRMKQQMDIAQGKEPEVMYPIVIDPDYTFTSSSSDGYLFGSSYVYNTAWTNTTGVASSYSVSTVGQLLTMLYQIFRSGLYFDTSGLSSAAEITAATLKLRGYDDMSMVDFNIQLVNGQPNYPHDPLENGDYNKSNYSDNGGVLSTSGFSPNYNNLNLSQTGLGWINKDGITKLFLRSSRDISGTAPVVVPPYSYAAEYVDFYTYIQGNGYWPQLLVTFTGPPMPPTNVAATDGTDTNNVQISWTASSGANGYSVYCNTDGGSTLEYVGSSDNSPYNDTSAVRGTLYYYYVEAYNGYGEGDPSACDTGWRKLLPPTNVAATDGSFSDKIRISWDASTGATSYKVYRNTINISGNATQVGTPASSPYDDTSAPNDDTCYYWVKASVYLGDSDFSSSGTGWRKGDDNTFDVGAFWVSNYDHHDDLPSDVDAQDFLDVMQNNSYQVAFNIGDSTPVDQSNFDDSTAPEYSPDGADLFWFEGHGDDGDLVLIHDWSDLFIYDRIYGDNLSWGDSDVEWAFLHSCQSLHSDDAPSNSYLKSNGIFAQALNGAHLICGADTDMAMYDNLPYDGLNVAEYLTGTGGPNHNELATVKNSWFWGVDENEDYYDLYNTELVNLRVIAEDSSYGNDYIWGEGTGPVADVSVNGYYYSWDYQCTPN